MKIADSYVTMGSSRQYQAVGTSGSAYEHSSGSTTNVMSNGGFGDMLNLKYSSGREGSMSENAYANYNNGGSFIGDIGSNNALNAFDAEYKMRSNIIMQILQRFSRSFSAGFSAGTGSSGGISLGGMSVGTMNVMTGYEAEETSFYAKGRAVTEDGRSIDFNIDIMMSRSIMQYTSVPVLTSELTDPLVVNLGSAVANISDQRFRFDLDADGTEEDIALPAGGTAFLALDLNEDGKINDGNELFGAKSGDGFGDLRKYDGDGNGWIDENDEIFSKLKVWYKDADGQDVLMDLKSADIGAIYLGEQSTEFTMDGMDGVTDGVIRSTGFFLKESGGAGTVQHVDLATGPVQEAEREVGEENFSSGYSYLNSDPGSIFNGNKSTSSGANKISSRADESAAQTARKRRLERKKQINKLVEDRAKRKEREKKFAEKQRMMKERLKKAYMIG